MKTFIRSFLGTASAILLVLLVVYLFAENRNENAVSTTIPALNNKIPTHSTNYAALPQNINFVEAADRSVNAVVHIKTEINIKSQNYHDFFDPLREYLYGNRGRNQSYVAFGSGVVISSDGYIVTNNHVVENADKISVTFNNREELTAELIGRDPTTDLALIKVNTNNLPHLIFGNSDELKVGEWVLAVGNPFNLTSTVTAGIVSAKARNINILGGASSIESFIQTDAVVNRGNSGGALVNTSGELIGINAAIASHTGVYEGYSFAIPANLAKKVVEDLKNYGEIQRAYLGVQLRDIDAEFANEMNLPQVEGVYVAEVINNSGAQDAGIEDGDIIVSVNGTTTNTFSELVGTIGQYRPGDNVNVTVNRDGSIKSFKVTLRNQDNTTAIVKSEEKFFNKGLNVSLQKVSQLSKGNMGIKSGLRITEINPGVLQRGGISEGFIITEVNGKLVNSKDDLENALDNSENGRVRLIGIYPNGMKVSYEFML
ncbi:MAG: deoxyribonuclease HsdR [Marinilabiliales bacterium]|nr:MAG: deoxyribonuclease HsdR [Marinilabiliales bacterium]